MDNTLCEVVPRPAFATPLTPGRPNLLAEAKGVAAMLGFTLAPWQEYFLALATEYEEGNPVDGIVPYWRYVTLTVPRQCGKSECVCTILYLLRWMGFYQQNGEDPRMVYTAHSMEAATDMWDTKAGKRLRECAWGRERQVYVNHNPANYHVRLGRKNLQLEGGRIRILASSGRSGRGGTEDMVVLDEAREFGEDNRREKTLDPLMNMRPSPQFIITSTMGVEESGYFNRKVDAGRDTARAQCEGEWPPSRLAYCEWGVGAVKPEDYDVADKGIWERSHPMLGYANWTLDRMAEKYDMARAEDDLPRFQQEYLNQMFVAQDAPAVPWEMLEAVEEQWLDWPDLGPEVVLSVFAEPGSYYLAAVAVGADCMRVVRPVEQDGEIRRVPVYGAEEWLVGFLTEQPQVRTVVFLEGNDLEVVLSKHKRRGVKMVGLKFPDYKEGCRMLKKALVSEQIRLRKSQFLRMAVAASEVVMSADQSSWFWARKKHAQAPADELKAAVLAWYMWRRKADKPRAGVVSLGDHTATEGDNRWSEIYAAGR